MVVVVHEGWRTEFPDPDACRRSCGHATTSELFTETLAMAAVKSPPF
jgi:hypothetical protein